MAGREGGGGVVGKSHSNSKEKQKLLHGRTDTDGSGQTEFLVVLFVLYHLILFLYHFLVNFCITIRLIILFV